MAPRSLLVALAVLAVTAGCLGGVPGSSTTTPTPPTAQWDAPDGPNEYPAPPSNLTDDGARQVAVAYEEAFVLNRLRASDVDGYGLGGVFGTEATVLNRSDGGVYVRVKRGYYTTDTIEGTTASPNTTARASKLHADGVSRATYFVSTETVRRVSGREIHG
jgi:hypothetical protein